MDKNTRDDEALTQVITQLLKDRKPQNVQQLIEMTIEMAPFPEQKIIERILQLQNQDKIILKEPSKPQPQNLGSYLKTKGAYWYWTSIILSGATTLAMFAIPEGAFPLVYVRYALVAIFVSWFPGYCFVRALFPAKPSTKKENKSLSAAERYALSLGSSLVLVALVGMLLNYTPWGIRLGPVGLSLFSVTVIFATAAVIREYQSNK